MHGRIEAAPESDAARARSAVAVRLERLCEAWCEAPLNAGIGDPDGSVLFTWAGSSFEVDNER